MTNRPGMDSDHVSILLDIKTEIGSLNANMLEAMHSRRRMEKSLQEVKEDLDLVKPVVLEVNAMKPKVLELLEFKARIGAYIVLGGAVVMGVFTLLGQGLSLFSDAIKKLFH